MTENDLQKTQSRPPSWRPKLLPGIRANGFFRSRWIRFLGLVMLAAALYAGFFTVSEAEFALVTQFGRPVAEYDQPGLKFKWPFQGLTRIGGRLNLYNPRPSEHLTRDKKNLLIENFVLWRVKEPLRFLRTVGDRFGAEMRLHDLIWSHVSAALGQTEFSEIVSVESLGPGLDSLSQSVTEVCNRLAGERYGIEIHSVDFKRVNLPAQNRESVFARMRAERERIARRYRAEGEEEARKIRAEADRAAEEILAAAYEQAEIIRGEGEAEATAIYGKAYSKDPEFYQLVRTLETYRKILDENTTVVLSTDSELLRLLTRGRNGKLVP